MDEDQEQDLARAEVIVVPQVGLTRLAAHMCLDIFDSARHRRKLNVGERLPEPVPDRTTTVAATPVRAPDRITLGESVNTALTVVLESLTPAARVAFVLRDMVALSSREIAAIVGRTPQMCRQRASVAWRHVRDRGRRETASEVHTRIVTAFRAACDTGDLTALVSLLDPEATALSDGGGKVRAALNPIHGAERTARFMLRVLLQHPALEATLQSVNGKTGLVLRHDTAVSGVVSFHVQDEKITDVWLVLNPDKLRGWNRS
ncbi:RNA polymerase subunit sigma-24 [Streptomyces sp. NBC_01799]|uniref:sigma factor-like helix-turn-helix DNA-binding protein n=1 Tax=Streptomyces sp. NBC_01800 TaxID=2975945 RepID=UPI002DD8739E|nr:sigma factor-like helix-turn-helix DNA-binding protein [Streptomyces sp. NBC_01800]WSA66124.1 RNA polymerase subunit sigma-24 [Streptomyces sp. NBC_01800]WSA74725.1 RNA polymerase subunit sigma-24 [Streptomyces sp. NBC_01799]